LDRGRRYNSVAKSVCFVAHSRAGILNKVTNC